MTKKVRKITGAFHRFTLRTSTNQRSAQPFAGSRQPVATKNFLSNTWSIYAVNVVIDDPGSFDGGPVSKGREFKKSVLRKDLPLSSVLHVMAGDEAGRTFLGGEKQFRDASKYIQETEAVSRISPNYWRNVSHAP